MFDRYISDGPVARTFKDRDWPWVLLCVAEFVACLYLIYNHGL